jgi:hypothetical protein
VIRHISPRSSSENIINSSRILTTLNMHISASILGGIVAISASANAALVRVNDFGSNPTNLQMNIYVPSRVATKPAIILGVRLTAPIPLGSFQLTLTSCTPAVAPASNTPHPPSTTASRTQKASSTSSPRPRKTATAGKSTPPKVSPVTRAATTKASPT